MISQTTLFTLLIESFIIYWWLCLAYSRSDRYKKQQKEIAKYAAWDKAYKKSVWDGKGQQQAVIDAIKAVNAKPHVMKVWNDTYNKAVDKGVRSYTAGVQASAAARKAAHE